MFLKLIFLFTVTAGLSFLGVIVINNIKNLAPIVGFFISYLVCLELLNELKKKDNVYNKNYTEKSNVPIIIPPKKISKKKKKKYL